ncbi:MAG TPA: type II secretion system F family protein [Acidimicrobiales bacterium]|nr:type II secretion system F family protein [Acidimicrobiales bacterium]
MPPYVVLAALAVALSLPLLAYSLTVDRASSRRIRGNLSAGVGEANLRQLVLSQSRSERILQPLSGVLARATRRLSPSGVVVSLERRLEVAGSAWPLEGVLAVKLVLGTALLVLGLAWAVAAGSALSFLGAVIAPAIGYFGPDTVLARRARARQLAISNQLPDTLDQLTICVEAGLGFDAALARTARTGRGPLAQELARLLQDLRVGVPRVEALNGMLERTDVPELRQFVHVIIQAESYGVPISKVLRTQAAEQREKRRFRAEERAMKLPVKVIFPMVFCILPTLFIVVLAPAFLNISAGFK